MIIEKPTNISIMDGIEDIEYKVNQFLHTKITSQDRWKILVLKEGKKLTLKNGDNMVKIRRIRDKLSTFYIEKRIICKN